MRVKSVSVYVMAVATFIVLIAVAYLSGIEAWARVALASLAGIAGIFVGIQAYRATSRRDFLFGGAFFATGNGLLVAELALDLSQTLAFGLLGAAFVLLLASALVLRRAQRALM